jgi:hypothetical protein
LSSNPTPLPSEPNPLVMQTKWASHLREAKDPCNSLAVPQRQ